MGVSPGALRLAKVAPYSSKYSADGVRLQPAAGAGPAGAVRVDSRGQTYRGDAGGVTAFVSMGSVHRRGLIENFAGVALFDPAYEQTRIKARLKFKIARSAAHIVEQELLASAEKLEARSCAKARTTRSCVSATRTGRLSSRCSATSRPASSCRLTKPPTKPRTSARGGIARPSRGLAALGSWRARSRRSAAAGRKALGEDRPAGSPAGWARWLEAAAAS